MVLMAKMQFDDKRWHRPLRRYQRTKTNKKTTTRKTMMTKKRKNQRRKKKKTIPKRTKWLLKETNSRLLKTQQEWRMFP